METEYSITQALSAQEAYNDWLWAIMAMIILGFNEFMLLLRNPLYLPSSVCYLSKAMWLAGLLALSSRFLPTITNLLRRLAEEGQGHPTPQPPTKTKQDIKCILHKAGLLHCVQPMWGLVTLH
ncbi:hypothetical protein POM88_034238 [Heracleum sosnowskyi]|uniref:Sey1/RHD3-like three-helix bundle domain-containing protein n=1 Tax=Heracleum sosnowskyi TaxID=360622 RepID=A0AAD8MC18_9APIA|nr:hypothetical protein POM88_034238 [Heracleum sosnowskyi]